MSVLVNTGVTRYFGPLVGTNGRPPATLSDSGYSLYGAASVYNGAAVPVSITPMVSLIPNYDAVSGLLGATLFNTQIPIPGCYHEIWYWVEGGVAHNTDRLLLVVDAQEPRLNLREVRHMVAQLLGDLWTGQATDATATTLVDPDRIESDHTNDWLYVYGGSGYLSPGLGTTERRVTAYNSTTGTLTFRTMTSPPAAGDLYELHKLFRVAEYNRAINLAVMQVAHHAIVPITDETLLITANTWPLEYSLPNGLMWLSDVWTRDETQTTNPDWVKLDDKRDYQIIPGRGLIRFNTAKKGTRVRIVGQMVPVPLIHDEEVPDVDPQYLVFKAAAHLMSGKMTSQANDTLGATTRSDLLHKEAEAIRPDRKPLPGSFRL